MLVADEQRAEISKRYYSIGSLEGQRHWLHNHVCGKYVVASRVKNSRRMTMQDYLSDENGGKVPVCRVLFLSTLAVGEEQIRTVLDKALSEYVMYSLIHAILQDIQGKKAFLYQTKNDMCGICST